MTAIPPLNTAELYRVLAESAPDAIVTIDESSVVLSTNPAGERLFGYSADEVVGSPLVRFMPARYQALHQAGVSRYLATGVRHITWKGIQLPILTKDGREIPVEISFGEFMSDGRRIFSGILRDVSERLNAEATLAANAEELQSQALELEHQIEEAQTISEELEQTNQELHEAIAALEIARREAEGANAAKTEFLRNVSHELRQPLNAIGGLLQLWELGLRGEFSEQQTDDIERIKRNQQQLSSLIEDLLSFARLEAGKLEVKQVRVLVNSVLDGLTSAISLDLEARGLTYNRQLADPSLSVIGDADRLHQVLVNLVTNAMKATASGGSIDVWCSSTGATVQIHVQDTGLGIPADKLEAIFNPFVQVGRALNQPREGAGLGLAISRGLAEAMGGTLTATSIVGEGSTFVVSLRQ